MQAPSFEGPRDVRQTAAYLQPFINGLPHDTSSSMALSASMATLMAQVSSGTTTTTTGKRSKDTTPLFPEDDDR